MSAPAGLPAFDARALARAAGMTPTHRSTLWMATEGDIKRLAEIVAAQLAAHQASDITRAVEDSQGGKL